MTKTEMDRMVWRWPQNHGACGDIILVFISLDIFNMFAMSHETSWAGPKY